MQWTSWQGHLSIICVQSCMYMIDQVAVLQHWSSKFNTCSWIVPTWQAACNQVNNWLFLEVKTLRLLELIEELHVSIIYCNAIIIIIITTEYILTLNFHSVHWCRWIPSLLARSLNCLCRSLKFDSLLELPLPHGRELTRSSSQCWGERCLQCCLVHCLFLRKAPGFSQGQWWYSL